MREGLARCRAAGVDGVVVLGHAEYYPRFGFVPAAQFGLRCEYDVPADVFMAIELNPDALGGVSGLVRYHEAFAAATVCRARSQVVAVSRLERAEAGDR